MRVVIGAMPAPHREVGGFDLLHVGAGAVDDACFRAGGLGGDGHAAAPAGVPVVAEPVHDEDVACSEQAERVVQQGAVRAGDHQRHGGARDPAVAQQRLDAPVAKTPVPPMPDRCGLRLFEQSDHLRADLGGHWVDLVFRHRAADSVCAVTLAEVRGARQAVSHSQRRALSLRERVG
jgi:hypothetical protein